MGDEASAFGSEPDIVVPTGPRAAINSGEAVLGAIRDAVSVDELRALYRVAP